MKGLKLPASLLAAALALAGPLAAQPPATESATLRLDCGGIGLDESQRMRAEAGLHALLILFATTDGSYLADVAVRIDDPLRDRRVASACGPIGLVDVPEPGRYRITATYGGVTQEQWLELKPGGGARISLRWRE